MTQYKWFLDVHGKKLKKTPEHKRNDVRIIVATKNALTTDYELHGAAYLRFIKWHIQHGTQLKWIEPQKAARIRHSIDELAQVDITDVALWDNFAVIFATSSVSGLDGDDVDALSEDDQDDHMQIALQMRFPRAAERDASPPNYEALAEYMSRVEQAAVEFPKGPPGLDVVDRATAESWAGYVGTKERMDVNGRFASFLRQALGDSKWAFDAAAGIGCESLLMQSFGLAVVSNEVDANLRIQAEHLASDSEMSLDLRGHQWSDLPAAVEGGGAGKFDAVICLGNSFCLLDHRYQQVETLRRFKDLVREGGRVIVDERNFKYFALHRQDILCGLNRLTQRALPDAQMVSDNRGSCAVGC
jgi:hypothetical protein